ncbi:MAG: hypothetical protein R3E12_07445 [Candidatus Eisenbacteria bacterium]
MSGIAVGDGSGGSTQFQAWEADIAVVRNGVATSSSAGGGNSRLG